MDCNKEEARRAQKMAEEKMENKDFIKASKFALMAKRLYPTLENIEKMLAVCEVHCSAQLKDRDWYGILQVVHTVDRASMKKQYRKLVSLLHPDNNKFPGADTAFKLVEEAQNMLSGYLKDSPTFWTSCPSCHTRYRFKTIYLNCSLQCPNCTKPFLAMKLEAPNPAGGRCTRKSPRQKQSVCYKECLRSAKRSKGTGTSNASSHQKQKGSALLDGNNKAQECNPNVDSKEIGGDQEAEDIDFIENRDKLASASVSDGIMTTIDKTPSIVMETPLVTKEVASAIANLNDTVCPVSIAMESTPINEKVNPTASEAMPMATEAVPNTTDSSAGTDLVDIIDTVVVTTEPVSNTVVNTSFAVTTDAAPLVALNETSTSIESCTSNDGLVSVGNDPDPASIPCKIEELSDTENIEVDMERMEEAEPVKDRPTFWTACSVCNTRYEYYKDILNRALRCKMCLKPFIAYDLNVQGVPSGNPLTQPDGPDVPEQKKGSHNGHNKGEELAPASVSDGRAPNAPVSDGIINTIHKTVSNITEIPLVTKEVASAIANDFDCPASIAMHFVPVKEEFTPTANEVMPMATEALPIISVSSVANDLVGIIAGKSIAVTVESVDITKEVVPSIAVNPSFVVTNDAAPLVAPNKTYSAFECHTSAVSNGELVSVGNVPVPYLQVSFELLRLISTLKKVHVSGLTIAILNEWEKVIRSGEAVRFNVGWLRKAFNQIKDCYTIYENFRGLLVSNEERYTEQNVEIVTLTASIEKRKGEIEDFCNALEVAKNRKNDLTAKINEARGYLSQFDELFCLVP
ncbi:hypothetical protein IFM89_035566 [Coptis chinensis]|uniref:J domain-containing protein n=1 Tax=Coptis chinensis TaxID=261450 RepID=A0A835HZV8_9MAGN|nr:hypothetical protein IFM89_035566 [Coptis chinensis]